MLSIGDKAPDFNLKDQNDQPTSLNDFRGQWIVLYFYPKDNTKGCTLEAKNFSDRTTDFNVEHIKIIGINPDSTTSHKKFEEKQNLSITLLSDPEQKTLNDYDVWKSKKMYGKQYMGVVRSTFLINPNGEIEYIWSKVKVPNHVNEVMNVIKEKKNLST